MKILIVTGIEGAANCVSAIAGLVEIPCELAINRKAAVSALKRNEYVAVVLDEGIADSDPAGVDLIWENAGLAVPVQVSFAVAGAQRLSREIRMALLRRERERALSHEAAAAAIQTELKSTLAGLLLHSQLALADREVSPPLAEKLRVVVDLAGSLRQQLSPAPTGPSRV
jgi:hypothetical protein